VKVLWRKSYRVVVATCREVIAGHFKQLAANISVKRTFEQTELRKKTQLGIGELTGPDQSDCSRPVRVLG
jgi:hypothetical protein